MFGEIMKSSRKSKVQSHFCFLMFCCCLISYDADHLNLAASEGETQSPNQLQITRQLDEVLAGKAIVHYRGVMARILSQASTGDLAVLKSYGNSGVALQAAWTEWVDDRLRLAGEFKLLKVTIGASRWLGFVEGRLGVEPPEAWSKCVQTAHPPLVPATLIATPFQMPSFIFDPPTDQSIMRVEILPGLFATRGITARRENNILFLSREDRASVQIDLDTIEENQLTDQGAFAETVVNWTTQLRHHVVVLHRRWNSPYSVILISTESPEKKWSAVGGGDNLLGTLVADFEIDVIHKKGAIYVFGYGSRCVLIDEFDVVSGKHSARFSSALW
jgi:hypothetical protein